MTVQALAKRVAALEERGERVKRDADKLAGLLIDSDKRLSRAEALLREVSGFNTEAHMPVVSRVRAFLAEAEK